MEKLLDVKSAAKLLSIGYRTTLMLCVNYDKGEKGGLRSVRVGKSRRIKPADLEAFIETDYKVALDHNQPVG